MGQSISLSGVRPDSKNVEALNRTSLGTDLCRLRSLLRGSSYHTKFLPERFKRLRPVTDLLEQHDPYCFTPEMKRVTRDLLREFSNRVF